MRKKCVFGFPGFPQSTAQGSRCCMQHVQNQSYGSIQAADCRLEEHSDQGLLLSTCQPGEKGIKNLSTDFSASIFSNAGSKAHYLQDYDASDALDAGTGLGSPLLGCAGSATLVTSPLYPVLWPKLLHYLPPKGHVHSGRYLKASYPACSFCNLLTGGSFCDYDLWRACRQ